MIITGRIGTAILIYIRLSHARYQAAISGDEFDVDQQHDVTQRYFIGKVALAIGVADAPDAAARASIAALGVGGVRWRRTVAVTATPIGGLIGTGRCGKSGF